MATVLRRYVLSRVARMWMLWFFWFCVLFFGWIVLAVRLDETGKPFAHILVWFCVTAICVFVKYRRICDYISYLKFSSLVFKRERSPETYDALTDIMRRGQLSVQPSLYFYPMPSSHINMCVVEGVTSSAIAVIISLGMLLCFEPRELRAVLAHEIAHVKNNDVVSALMLQTLFTVCVLYGAVYTYLYATSVGIDNFRGLAAALVMTLFALVAGLFLFPHFHRRCEYAADEVGAHILGSPVFLIKCLQKLQQQLGEGSASLWNHHPPFAKRIEALEKLKSRLG